MQMIVETIVNIGICESRILDERERAGSSFGSTQLSEEIVTSGLEVKILAPPNKETQEEAPVEKGAKKDKEVSI